MKLLPTNQLRTLIALHDMQPCTVNALNAYLGHRHSNHNHALDRLRMTSLVTRAKYVPPTQTREQILGTAYRTLGHGKRPYLYRLTPQGEAVAAHLHAAAIALSEVAV